MGCIDIGQNDILSNESGGHDDSVSQDRTGEIFTAQAELVWPIADSITTYLNAFLIVSVYYVLENVFPQLACQLPR